MMVRGTLVAGMVAGMILGAEASASAQTLGPPIPIAAPVPTGTDGSQGLGLLSGTDEYAILVYNDFAGYYGDARVARVDRATRVVTELDLRLPNALDLACVGTVCAATLSTPAGGVIRFDVDGTLIDASPIVLDGFAYVAAAGDHFLVVTNPGAPGTESTEARSLSATGPASTALGPVHSIFDSGIQESFECGPVDCLLLRRALDGYHAIRVSHAGSPTGSDLLLAPPVFSGWPPVIAPVGGDYRVAWTANADDWYVISPDDTVTTVPRTFDDYRDVIHSVSCMADGRCVYGGGLDYAGVWDATGFTRLGPGALVTCGPVSCIAARVVAGTIALSATETIEGTLFLGSTFGVGATVTPQGGFVAVGGSMAVFHRYVERQYVAMAVRLDAAGAPTGAPWVLDDPRTLPVRFLLEPVGTSVAVAREQRLDIYDAAGARADGRYLEECLRVTSVSWNGTHFLVSCRRDTAFTGPIVTRRYDAVAQLVDTTSTVLSDAAEDAVLVADPESGGWTAYIDTGRAIRRRAIAADGTLAATDTLVRDGAAASVRAARGATGDHVVWIDGGDNRAIRGAVVDGGGTVTPLGGRLLASTAVEYDAYAFVTVGGRSNTLVAWSHTNTRRVELQAIDASATPIGASIEVAPIEPFTRGRVWSTFDVALGQRTILYERSPSVVEPVLDVFVRTLSEPLGAGEPCTGAGECGSGFCVGGVCCDRACDGGCESCGTGTCAVRAAGAVCREPVDVCDTAEVCDGTAASCPAAAVGVCADAGEADAGVGVDAPSSMSGDTGDPGGDTGVGGGSSGCSVAATPSATSWPAVMAFAVLVAVATRRRARGSRIG